MASSLEFDYSVSSNHSEILLPEPAATRLQFPILQLVYFEGAEDHAFYCRPFTPNTIGGLRHGTGMFDLDGLRH